MDHSAASIAQMKKMLENLDKWLSKAEAHAKDKKIDAHVLLGLRLIADQYPLVRQVQSACDTAKFAAARLAGKTPPSHPDTEQTLEELHARIQKTCAYLAEFTAKDFEGADARKVVLPFIEGRYLHGADYLVEMAQPNFYFHVTTAYAILRKAGVDVGKIDFIGSLTTHPA
jgi:hypothetical protein